MTVATLERPVKPRTLAPLKACALALAGAAGGLALGGLLVALIATRLFGFEVLTVRSGSMEPAIGRGDLIVVRPVSIAKVEEGDVVLFAAGGDGIPTVHRVAGINEIELRVTDVASGTVESSSDYRLVTKGDANGQPDLAEVDASRLRGEVWFTVPRAGALLGWPMQYLLFGLAVLSLVAWSGWEAAQRRRR